MSVTDRIAIVGIGGIFPDAHDLTTFWENILAGRSAAKAAPANRWTLTANDALSQDIAPDHVYSHRACFVEDFTLDLSGYELSDELADLIPQLDVMNHLAIHAGHQAWQDANMTAVDRSRVGIIIGNIALPTDSVSQHAQQIIGPAYAAALSKILGHKLDWDHTPTHVLNRYVAGLPGGLLAQTLGIGGGAHTLDAACASSLYALKYACDELLAGRADAMIAGGLSRPDCLYTQMGFSQLHALSKSGVCAPFSDRADGLVVGEGAGIVILKHLDDAVKHGDHIYATIAGIGLSNDITGSIMAPDVEGQGRAMRRAYELAGWKPSDVDHIECHGTGTPVGDNVEFTSLKNLWQNESQNALKQRQNKCVIGSVKSNVGHLLTGAGGAGLIKTLLAIKHKTLPPTANFTAPNPKMGIPESPFEVLSQPRAWHTPDKTPRKAAVSAFGFGGINAHVLLEEYVESKTTLANSELPGAVESDEPIAIVGMAGHFGPYKNLDDLRRLFINDNKQPAQPIGQTWGVALANKTGHVIEDIAIELGRFPIPPLELQDMLPQQLLMLLAAADALNDAGIEHSDAPRLDMGVYIGIGLDLNTTNFHLRWELANQAKNWADQIGVPYSEQWLDDLRDAMNPPLTANRTMGALGGIVASRVARAFKVGGPSFTISSEQTSTLHAITQAVTSLRRGEIDSAIVGAVEQGCDVRHVATDSSDMPCCDGAGAVILKRLSDAREDGDTIYAVIDQTSRFGIIDDHDAMHVDAMDDLGDLGPATSIASLIKASLCLYHRFDLKTKGFWLADQSEQVRQCLIASDSIDGNTASITLCEADVCQTVDLDANDQSTFDITDDIAKGKIAFVFPGAGNQFANMGKDLCTPFAHVIEQMHLENNKLKSQFANGKFWDGTPVSDISHKNVIFGQVCLGTMISDIALSIGIKPDAMIGYSLGETTCMFASRSWTTRDEMLDRMNNSSLFTTDLAGPCDAARKTWQLDDDEPVDWVVTVVPRTPEMVREVLADFDRAYLLIINKADECVIGGDRLQVRQAVQQLGASWHPVDGVTTVHCEVAHAIRDDYRELHLMPTAPPTDITFYSGIAGQSYQVTRESIAESIVGQAMEPFDFSKVVEAAYADGVRVFIEMGPGNSCTRLIDQILSKREHLAVSLCRDKQDNVATLLKVARTLKAMGQEIVLPIAPATEAKQTKTIHVAAMRRGFEIPQPPFVIRKQEEQVPEPVMRENVSTQVSVEPSYCSDRVDTTRLAGVNAGVPMDNGIVAQAIAAQQAHVATQQTFMRVSQNLNNTMAKAISMYHTAMGNGDFSRDAQTSIPAAIEVKQQITPALNREQCMEFAIGSIGKALGEKFAAIDANPTRVRLPDEPLMLVDRIMEIEGEACSMTHGRVVTEHDIHPGAWYLDGGVIPTCIAVEAGQADLFLSGYLGIDFITKGQAVYRLLDAEVTFHMPLPGPGKTINYDIHIDEFFRQDDTYLFRFRFDATVDGQLFLTMHKGCAGFFTQGELDAGKGIVLTRLDKKNENGLKTGGFSPLAPMAGDESYSTEQINALRHGDLVACFGEAFASIGLQQAKGLPGANGGRMNLVHRILSMQPNGGRFGLGQIVGEADIHPDDWFITCHFCDDQVMPGTLMYECCLHTLRVYLLRLGWVGEETEFLYEPKPGIPGQLKCRGQVLADTKKVWYEITVKEIGYDETAKPYVIADALMYGDGKPIVQMKNMSLQLSGLTKQALEARWDQAQDNPSRFDPSISSAGLSKTVKPTIFDNASILAFAQGNPSDAFGDKYKVFDNERKIARLPRPPYKLLDRIVHIENCEQWKLNAGGVIEAEYDVPADEWYFAQDRQAVMPFAVLLEVALQPCGWLAAYLGSALTSDTDLRFRNLGGDAVQLLPVTPDIGTLTTRIKITNVSQSGGMIIQHFDMHTYADRGDVYKGTTYFGFFTAAALANQVGIREAQVYEPTDREFVRTEPFNYPTIAPYPDDMMRMLDRIVVFDPNGGSNGLGIIRGEMDVNPDRWFFQAHFYQDPVCPGSLGLESFLQLLKVYATDRWGASAHTQFECMALGEKHKWVYRGQIIPTDSLVTVQAVIKAVDDATHTIVADGFLIVDGRVIYQMIDFAIRAK